MNTGSPVTEPSPKGPPDVGREISVVLARYHDGTAKANWGGRATSLALASAVTNSDGRHLTDVINGTYLTESFGDFGRKDKIAMRLAHMNRRFRGHRGTLRTRPFSDVEDYARAFLRRKKSESGAKLVALVESGDELWMNGEGDLIAAYSGSLWRCLMILSIAQHIGVPTRLVNSILSAPGDSNTGNDDVISGMREVLGKCKSVVLRDPESLRLCQSWFPCVDSSWLPDALFSWSGIGTREESPWYGPDSEGLSTSILDRVTSRPNLIAISGSSSVRSSTPNRINNLTAIFEQLRNSGMEPLCIATSDEDRWMQDVADHADVSFVPPHVPLATGRRLLRESAAFGSGRYHPAILALGVGTPCVFTGSNSHKTSSLQQLFGLSSPEVYDPFNNASEIKPFVAKLLACANGQTGQRSEIERRAVGLGEEFSTGIAKLGSSAKSSTVKADGGG
ncbi:hypothetical protein CH267_04710 [Rhodococcus sp. 06-621-2]|nr:hypothetical protein CH267_04710 [Rhodococcus sp. 06-621-2]